MPFKWGSTNIKLKLKNYVQNQKIKKMHRIKF